MVLAASAGSNGLGRASSSSATSLRESRTSSLSALVARFSSAEIRSSNSVCLRLFTSSPRLLLNHARPVRMGRSCVRHLSTVGERDVMDAVRFTSLMRSCTYVDLGFLASLLARRPYGPRSRPGGSSSGSTAGARTSATWSHWRASR